MLGVGGVGVVFGRSVVVTGVGICRLALLFVMCVVVLPLVVMVVV